MIVSDMYLLTQGGSSGSSGSTSLERNQNRNPFKNNNETNILII